MADPVVIDVVVSPAPLVVEVHSVGVQGPPGEPGPPGPAGPAGEATLPTAPLGQVLISQGAGVPSVMSGSVTVDAVTAGSVAATDVGVQNSLTSMGQIASARSDGAGLSSFFLALGERTVAQLPAMTVGALASVSDSTTDVDGAIIAGGGAKHVLARWNGTNWRVVGGESTGGAPLPTAPIGEVLISQGVGTPPVFSNAPHAGNSVLVGQASWNGTTISASRLDMSDVVVLNLNSSTALLTIGSHGGLRISTFTGGGCPITVTESASAPAAPAANTANLWLQDNGAGKSQLMVQFATGAPIAIATQA